MAELATAMPGCVSYKDYADDEGESITLGLSSPPLQTHYLLGVIISSTAPKSRGDYGLRARGSGRNCFGLMP